MANESWKCDGLPKNKNQSYGGTGPHEEREVNGPLCDCGLPKVAMKSSKKSTYGALGWFHKKRKIMLPLSVGAILLSTIAVSFGIRNRLLVSRQSRFVCEVRRDQNGPTQQNGGNEDVLTITYRQNSKSPSKPWLLIVEEFGGGYTPARRCDEIASRLEGFRQDGLVALDRDYSEAVKLPIICVYTKAGGDNCQLLVTLTEDTDPETALKSIATHLIDENKKLGVYHGPSSQASVKRGSYFVDLRPHLSEEDKRAGG